MLVLKVDKYHQLNYYVLGRWNDAKPDPKQTVQALCYVSTTGFELGRCQQIEEGIGEDGEDTARYGICQRCTDIIRVQFPFIGVKCCCKNSLFVENLCLTALMCCFW